MSDNVQRYGSRDCKKENPYFERRKKMKKWFLGTVSHTIRQSVRLWIRPNKPDYICSQRCRDIMQWVRACSVTIIARLSTTSFIFAMTSIAQLSTLKG
jgi:hypothetical protein